VVQNLDLPALDVYRHLTDKHLKCRSGYFIAEGLEVVRRLLRSRFRVHSLLLTPRKLERLREEMPSDAPVFVATVEQMQAVAGFTIHRGALACGVREPGLDLEAAVAAAGDARLVVVLENICDAQNVGVIIRNAAAFGANLVVLAGCCDPFYRRAVRVSMGNVFCLPLYQTERLVGDLQGLRRRLGLELIAADVSEAATPLDRAAGSRRVGLLFGAEGDGLSPAVLEICDRRVVIPMAAGSDSVNVGVASGIFLHAYSAWATAASAVTGSASTNRLAARE
jgi:tRNA G18 (ribose-2'-O)-methylase SpoU